MNNGFLKSPLNYTGNKHRILPQIIPYFPKKINVMVDMFCGGATVGINSNADKVIFIDSNPRVIGLLKFLAKSDFEKLLKKLAEKIEKYNLSASYLNGYAQYFNCAKPSNKNNGLKDYNKIGFYKLRDDYNIIDNKNSDEANLLLYLLLVYGFNNDLRFNFDGDYNLPCGKTDLNKNNINKIEEFIKKAHQKNFEFICGDFRSKKIQDIILNADFVYLDPPYLITDAVYNESDGWNSKKEIELLNFLNKLSELGKPFVLSNVLEKQNGQLINEPLQNFILQNKKIKVVDIDYHYRSASYNKIHRDAKEREIIVVSR